MRVIQCDQSSPEWYEARCGIPSASNFHRIYAVASDKMSDGMDKYIAELVAERQCHLPNYFSGAGKPSTPAMQRGHDMEPVARAWYEKEMGKPTHRVGFCVTDCGRFGCSPDFLLGDDVCGEIKCLSDRNHSQLLHYDAIPPRFAAQCYGQLLVTGRPIHHFVLWSETLERRIVRTFAAEKQTAEKIKKLRIAMEVFWARYEKALKMEGLEWPVKPLQSQHTTA